MTKDNNIKRYSAAELKAMRSQSRTDWAKADAVTDEDLDRLASEDEDLRRLETFLKPRIEAADGELIQKSVRQIFEETHQDEP